MCEKLGHQTHTCSSVDLWPPCCHVNSGEGSQEETGMSQSAPQQCSLALYFSALFPLWITLPGSHSVVLSISRFSSQFCVFQNLAAPLTNWVNCGFLRLLPL